jgi:aspartyl-tRNA synthetase
MIFTKIKNIIKTNDTSIQGFVKNIRDKKNICFLVVGDISGEVQVTILKENNEELANVVSKLTIDSVINVYGKVVENENVKLNGVEIIPNKIEIVSIANELPVDENSLIDQKISYR